MGKKSLAFRTARGFVARYEDESSDLVLNEHYEAQDCQECESFLQLGIDAFEWLMRADLAIRRAVYGGERDYDARMDENVTLLLRRWQEPCKVAELWIAEQIKRGYEVSNLEEFRKCCREVADILTPDEEFFRDDALVALRDEALDQFAQGQTDELRAT